MVKVYQLPSPVMLLIINIGTFNGLKSDVASFKAI